MPEFPKRKLWGITNENPEDIEKRREDLEKYLNGFFSNDLVLENEVAKYFLDEAKRQAEHT